MGDKLAMRWTALVTSSLATGLVVGLALGALPARWAAAQTCAGDCDGNGAVTVNEIVTMVDVALDFTDLSTCVAGDHNGDGAITVNEIIGAINLLLSSTEISVTVHCELPPDTPSEIKNCPDNTPVTLYRCTDLAGCANDPAARVAIATGYFGQPQPPEASGSGNVQFAGIAECSPNATHLYRAPVADDSIYFAVAYPDGAGAGNGGAAVARAASPQTVTISPLSEAAVRLVDTPEQGLQNFGAVTFATVLADIQSAVPLASLAGKSPADAANTATMTAQSDPNVTTDLGMVLKHHKAVSESIDPEGDVDHYHFELHDSTTVVLQMTQPAGLTPCIKVQYYGTGQTVPDGQACHDETVRLNLTGLPAGTYDVFVSDSTSGQKGFYDLYYLRLRPEDETDLAVDETQAGALIPAGQLDPYTFQVTQSTEVTVHATQVSSNVSPCVELWQYEPSGSTLVTSLCDTSSAQLQEIVDAGTYIVLVYDEGSNDEGAYALKLLESLVGAPTRTMLPTPPRTMTPTPSPMPTRTPSSTASAIFTPTQTPTVTKFLTPTLTLPTATAPPTGRVGDGTMGSCSEAALRSAVAAGGIITFSCGGYATITLTSPVTVFAATVIDGGGSITLDGGGTTGLFTVNSGVPLALRNLTISNAGSQAAIVNDGTLQVTNTDFVTNNSSAINNDNGSVTVTNSTFANNHASQGGAIFAHAGTVTVTDSTFADNYASGGYVQGGAIYISGGTMNVTNSTFAGNYANRGGALFNYNGAAVVTNCTFTGNSAGVGNGGAILNYSGNNAVKLTNTIVANSSEGGNCVGTITDGGHNIDDGTTCKFTCTAVGGSSYCNTPPQLDPAGLADNGGPTQTVALCTAAGVPAGCIAASPALSAGDGAGTCVLTTGTAPVNNRDQRGAARGASSCSIGAYEGGVSCESGACAPGTAPASPTLGTIVTNCSEVGLTQALTKTNPGTITFNCAGSATITLTNLHPPTISAATVIDGGSSITLDGGGTTGLFTVNSGVPLTLRNLTISNAGSQAAIVNDGTLQVTNTTFVTNNASAINNDNGSVTVTNSTFANNHASQGGAIFAHAGTVTVTDSTFADNYASGGYVQGGAIYISGGTMNVTNSTFAGNYANQGGALFNYNGAAVVTNCTFTGNSAGVGNGGAILNYSGNNVVKLTNTIVANSSEGGNCVGTITDGGHNIDDGSTCKFTCMTVGGSSYCNTPPQLDPAGLADNGGPTQTVALCTAAGVPAGCIAASPALSAGDGAGTCVLTTGTAPVNNRDQRGAARGASSCSIGAYEGGVSCESGACAPGTPPASPTLGTIVTNCSQVGLTQALTKTNPGIITFNCAGSAPITLTSPVTVSAATVIDGVGSITLDGGGTTGLFTVNSGVPLTLRNLTISNAGSQAAIVNDGTLQVTNTTFVTNNASAINNDNGSVTVTNSTFANNHASQGGAIFAHAGTVTVTDSTFADNYALGGYVEGGAIYIYGGTMNVTNSTFAGNYANRGGALFNYNGAAVVTNCTFTGNSAGVGNGGAILNYSGNNVVKLTNTIVANSSEGGNCVGTITDGGHNIDDGNTGKFTCTTVGGSSYCNTPPQLDPAGLADNGGPTQTVALCTAAGVPAGCIAASPALSAGDGAGTCVLTTGTAPVNNRDQRGAARGASSCSIGAYEGGVSCESGACAPGTAPASPTLGTIVTNCSEVGLTQALTKTNPGIITFNCAGSAPITLTSPVTVSAATVIDGVGSITLDGGGTTGLFTVNSGVPLTLRNLTISNAGSQAAIVNDGTLQVTNATFVTNNASAINNDNGSVTVTNSTFANNHASQGGAIFAHAGTVTVTDSTFADNYALGGYVQGGAIYISGGTMNVTNSTFAGNYANQGGALFNYNGAAVVTNCTFTGNSAGVGNGGAILNYSGNNVVKLTNTIVANSSTKDNCKGSVTDGGYNIDDGTTCGFQGSHCANTTGTSLCNTNPLLAGLNKNGGPTQTSALQAGSPAINAGNEMVCATTMMSATPAPVNNLDQRGYVRPGAGAANCSIGAFEYNASPPNS